MFVGALDGAEEGFVLGFDDGIDVGVLLGTREGFVVVVDDGSCVGCPVGECDGDEDGSELGIDDGVFEGISLIVSAGSGAPGAKSGPTGDSFSCNSPTTRIVTVAVSVPPLPSLTV